MRFLVSSQNLLTQVRPHRTSERLSITMDCVRGCCTLLSPAGTTELPMEGRHDVTATVNTHRLFAALLEIEDQPITLDLHSWPGAANKLYACQVIRHEDKDDEHLQSISFDLS